MGEPTFGGPAPPAAGGTWLVLSGRCSAAQVATWCRRVRIHLARPAAGPVFDRSPRPACRAPAGTRARDPRTTTEDRSWRPERSGIGGRGKYVLELSRTYLRRPSLLMSAR